MSLAPNKNSRDDHYSDKHNEQTVPPNR